MEEDLSKKRTLTDADIEAILTAAEKKFYLNLGKGFWRIVWTGLLGILIGIAAFGHFGNR